VVWGLDESHGGSHGYGGYYGGYYSEYYGGARADSGVRNTIDVTSVGGSRQFVMPEERAPGRLAKWRSGWRLGLLVFVVVVVILAAVVLALNARLGWLVL